MRTYLTTERRRQMTHPTAARLVVYIFRCIRRLTDDSPRVITLDSTSIRRLVTAKNLSQRGH